MFLLSGGDVIVIVLLSCRRHVVALVVVMSITRTSQAIIAPRLSSVHGRLTVDSKSSHSRSFTTIVASTYQCRLQCSCSDLSSSTYSVDGAGLVKGSIEGRGAARARAGRAGSCRRYSPEFSSFEGHLVLFCVLVVSGVDTSIDDKRRAACAVTRRQPNRVGVG